MQKHEKLFDLSPVVMNAMVIVGILLIASTTIGWKLMGNGGLFTEIPFLSIFKSGEDTEEETRDVGEMTAEDISQLMVNARIFERQYATDYFGHDLIDNSEMVTRPFDGTDVIIVLDTSASMNALDYAPNRLEAVKETLGGAIAASSGKRIGLVIFSGSAFTMCPLTTDMGILGTQLENVDWGDVRVQGTNITDAIIIGLSRISDTGGAMKEMILISDGEQNIPANFEPGQAAQLAERLGIVIHTVAIGGEVPVPIPDPYDPSVVLTDENGDPLVSTLDTAQLESIADIAGGRFYHAEDRDGLEAAFAEILE